MTAPRAVELGQAIDPLIPLAGEAVAVVVITWPEDADHPHTSWAMNRHGFSTNLAMAEQLRAYADVLEQRAATMRGLS